MLAAACSPDLVKRYLDMFSSIIISLTLPTQAPNLPREGDAMVNTAGCRTRHLLALHFIRPAAR